MQANRKETPKIPQRFRKDDDERALTKMKQYKQSARRFSVNKKESEK
jgi:hypothetical protein